jgi:hypothetical protein
MTYSRQRSEKHLDQVCHNPFLDPRTKKAENTKKYVIKKYNSAKRMPEHSENSQKLVEEVQKYKD